MSNVFFRSTPDYDDSCENCSKLKFAGTFQVGSYESGGPEKFYKCELGHEIHHRYANTRHCPDRTGQDEYDY